MASRLLSRSKTLALSRCLLRHPSAAIDPVAHAQCVPALGSLASRPLSDPRSAAAATTPRSAAVASLLASAPGLARAPVFGHLVSGKSCGYEKTLPNHFFNSFHGSPQHCNNMSHMVGGVEANCLKGKENDRSKVIAFSPLEGTLTKERKSGLLNESLKEKRMELSIKTTYALIPALLLVSKTKLTTSMLVLCVYWQVYGFFKEMFLDYVHHEATRKWVLIYFKLLLFILAKDTILAFDLV